MLSKAELSKIRKKLRENKCRSKIKIVKQLQEPEGKSSYNFKTIIIFKNKTNNRIPCEFFFF